MTIYCPTSDRFAPTALSDARLYDQLNGHRSGIMPGIGDEMAVSIVGQMLTVGLGVALLQGREIVISEPETVTIPPEATAGWYVTIKHDLTRENSSTGTPGTIDYIPLNNQTSIAILRDLILDDLNDGGSVHTLALGTLTGSSAGWGFTKNAAANLGNQPTSLADGGTGAKTAAAARTNLGVANAAAAATQSTMGLLTAADKTKLDGIAAKAEVNQNAFSNVYAGTTLLSASSKTDTFTITGANGGGVDVLYSGVGKTAVVVLSDARYTTAEKNKLAGITGGAQPNPGVATTSANGLMSAAQVTALNNATRGVATNKNNISSHAISILAIQTQLNRFGITASGSFAALMEALADVTAGSPGVNYSTVQEGGLRILSMSKSFSLAANTTTACVFTYGLLDAAVFNGAAFVIPNVRTAAPNGVSAQVSAMSSSGCTVSVYRNGAATTGTVVDILVIGKAA